MALISRSLYYLLFSFTLLGKNVALSFQLDQPKRNKLENGMIPKILQNMANKEVLDLTEYPDAKCLDGSPGAYYFSPGSTPEGSNKFFIYRMGGAFCTDMDNCLLRSQNGLGTSIDEYWPALMDLNNPTDGHMGFIRDAAQNPAMWSWNHVFVIYCDGAYFAGSNATQKEWQGEPLFFHGGDIQSAILYDLRTKFGLDQAQAMTIGGCSAGGISTYMTVDKLVAHPAAPKNAKIAALACGGYFLPEDAWVKGKMFSYYSQNLTGLMNPKCITENMDMPQRCVSPAISAYYLNTPLFIWESKFDTYRMQNVYNCWLKTSACTNDASRRELTSLQKLILEHPQIGMYLDGCEHHCDDAPSGDIRSIRLIRGDTMLQAFAKWFYHVYEGKSWSNLFLQEMFERSWIEPADYPCTQCCPGNAQGHVSWLRGME